MSGLEERVAVLESLAERASKDTSALFEMLRKHMEKEETDRDALLAALNQIRIQQQKQKSFVGGIVFTVSSLWAVILLGITHYFKSK